ncbi:transcription factor bhlh144 [Phtheirospermum japonicum]|uniref:Transcription factor bhlh144 n=1 Tax=Phtheirospermum japonicum TaxID=374723 RepID=A0A830CKJ6_9LAMI|nr:transcription factor bhlh144 [Phtheirospermum japonicum]
MASVLNGFIPPGINRPMMPFHTVDIQPSSACPRNFIIFDQTNNKSQIMFHPEISSKLCYPGFNVEPSIFPENVIPNDEDKTGSSFEEDYDDIDALLSSEYEEEPEDDEVSTARTGPIYECGSPDSCSNYEPVPKKKRTLFRKSSENRGNEKKKHKKVRKMVKALRGIVPGANRMSSVAVLDEAVRYLKSLRVEVQKLGIKNF